MKPIIALPVLLLLLAPAADAEGICQSDPHFRDFDFWLGSWQVTARASGQLAGTNRIQAIEDGCALQEVWTGQTGGSGMSLNWYNPATGLWRQVWIARPGYFIDIAGGLQDGSMVLEGHITTFHNQTELPFRGTWTPNNDGTVRQFFEQYSEADEQWQTWFDGLYTPVDEASEPDTH